MDEFERELAANMTAIDIARASLVQRVRQLTDDDLARTRRGGWSVREVLRLRGTHRNSVPSLYRVRTK